MRPQLGIQKWSGVTPMGQTGIIRRHLDNTSGTEHRLISTGQFTEVPTVTSPCSLGFLTAWQPQGNQTPKVATRDAQAG
jgi:hypothetical protein